MAQRDSACQEVSIGTTSVLLNTRFCPGGLVVPSRRVAEFSGHGLGHCFLPPPPPPPGAHTH